MALSEFRDTHSWQEAIELGPQLVRLAEDLPVAEQMGLSLQLREAMVALPAAIAVDLLEGGSNTRKPATLRLVAMLDLIEKIYPALDTADVRAAVDTLAERISSNSFGEQTAGAATAYLPGATTPASDEHPAVDPDEPAPAPAAVPVVPEAAPASESAAPEPATAEATAGGAQVAKIHVTPDGTVVPAADRQENNVQPDSVKQTS